MRDPPPPVLGSRTCTPDPRCLPSFLPCSLCAERDSPIARYGISIRARYSDDRAAAADFRTEYRTRAPPSRLESSPLRHLRFRIAFSLSRTRRGAVIPSSRFFRRERRDDDRYWLKVRAREAVHVLPSLYPCSNFRTNASGILFAFAKRAKRLRRAPFSRGRLRARGILPIARWGDEDSFPYTLYTSYLNADCLRAASIFMADARRASFFVNT